MRLLVIFIIIWLYRLLSNVYYLKRSKFLSDQYSSFWVENKIGTKEYKSEIIQLFKKANIKEQFVGHVQPLGLGQMQTGNASVFENMFINNKNIVAVVIGDFDTSIGVYKQRIRENFNPFFWIETILYLPKNIFTYLGLNGESAITKIGQIIYWLLCGFYAIYSEQINKIIQNFLSNLFK